MAADVRQRIVATPSWSPDASEVGGPWTRDEMAGALLHDVGKLDAGLGTFGRVLATVVGPRTATVPHYHDHERIGADCWLADQVRRAETVDLVLRQGPRRPSLERADNI